MVNLNEIISLGIILTYFFISFGAVILLNLNGIPALAIGLSNIPIAMLVGMISGIMEVTK